MLKEIIPCYVENIPEEKQEGILYIALTHKVAVHLCACGCKEKVVTLLDKEHGWILSYNQNVLDGKKITLRPSIGNFNIKCKSHYYITENKIEWL